MVKQLWLCKISLIYEQQKTKKDMPQYNSSNFLMATGWTTGSILGVATVLSTIPKPPLGHIRSPIQWVSKAKISLLQAMEAHRVARG
jgi:hypothetical protein